MFCIEKTTDILWCDMPTIHSKKEKIASCLLHWLEGGVPGSKSIILLHGMKFQARTWEKLGTLEVLAAAGYHVLALDMPGFGESAPCPLAQEDVLAAFIKQRSLQAPVLLGPSMGGRIVLEFALDHSGETGGLILVGAVGVEENQHRLADLKLPVAIIWGSEDQIAPLAHSELLEQAISGSRREIIQGAPHPCYLEQPEQFHALLLDFLGSLQG